MRLKITLLLAAGAVLTLGAGAGTLHYLRNMEAAVAEARAELADLEDTARVPVALRDLPRGATATAGDFTTLRISARPLPGNVLRALEPLPEGIEGYTALRDLRAGELLTGADLAVAPQHPDFAFALSADARAIGLRPENLGDFAGLLSPGALVDVFWTRPGPGGAAGQTRLLGSGLRILALPEEGEPRLLIEGTGTEVARTIAAQQNGTFHIAPTLAPLDPAAAEVVVPAGVLADLPLAVRDGGGEGGSGGGPAAMLPDGAREFITQLGGGERATRCTLVVVRQSQRSTVEVPC